MIKRLPDFSKNKFVFVVGSGPSLSEIPRDVFLIAPTVGCNSVSEYIKTTVWCTAHSAWQEESTIRYAKMNNYEHAFVARNLIVEGDPRDIREEAKELFSEDINNKINWIDINADANAKDVIFSREPYEFSLPQGCPAMHSSGIIIAEVAVRLGARALVVVGSDYAFSGVRRHWQDDETCKIEDVGELGREEYFHDVLLEHHKEYYSTRVDVPVYYIGSNPELRRLHIPIDINDLSKIKNNRRGAR